VNFLSNLSINTRAWMLLTLSALTLEASALYFQYVMGLAPCIMCIYQRTALWAICIGGVIGCLGNKLLLGRIIAYSLWAVGAIWGLVIAIEHVEIQNAAFSFMYSCEFVPNFPTWAPLHEWLPMLFEANGDCGDIDWQFLGQSMPQMMIVVFGIYSLILCLALVTRLLKTKMV